MASATHSGDNDDDPFGDHAGDGLLDEAADWLLRLEAAPGDESVRAGLRAWIDADPTHAEAFQRMERMWHVAGGLPSRRRTSARRVRRPAFVAAAALAACLLLALYPILGVHISADHVTATGEVRDVTLADGSTMTLGAGSAIAVDYDAGFRRVELLRGQAFFDVAAMPERPFSVDAAGVRATVTGTMFSVHAGVDDVEVALAEGAVEVSRIGAANAPVRLKPGERAVVAHAGGAVETADVAVAEIAAWRAGRLIVRGETLAEVVETLDRYHPGVIVIADARLGQARITGNFDLRHPAEALDAAVRTRKGAVTRVTPYVAVVRGR